MTGTSARLGYVISPFECASTYLSVLGNAQQRTFALSMHLVLFALRGWGQVGRMFVSGKPLVDKRLNRMFFFKLDYILFEFFLLG